MSSYNVVTALPGKRYSNDILAIRRIHTDKISSQKTNALVLSQETSYKKSI